MLNINLLFILIFFTILLWKSKFFDNLIGLSKEQNFISVFPPVNLCSDNAAMIAWVGIERFKINLINNLEFPSKARWPLDNSAPFLKGPGLKI